MVSRNHRSGSACEFVIRPHRSLDWRQTQLAFATVAAPCLLVGAGFAAVGFWPVLPFAGLEVLLLGVAFYVCALRGQNIEVVAIGEREIAVRRGRRELQEVWAGRRAWSRVQLRPSPHRLHPSRLYLCSHGREIAVGDCLTEEERRALAVELERVLDPAGSAAGASGTSTTRPTQGVTGDRETSI